MADFKTIDTSTFDSAITAFARALIGYKDARDLINNKTNILSEHWNGAGGEKFRKVMNGLKKGLEDDCESMEHIISQLVTMKQAYADADAEVARKIQESTT